MEPVVDYAKLERIGNELYDRSRAGTLDFPAFQKLFHEAVVVCGAASDQLEMFCPFAKPPDWFAWMTQELKKASSQRVA